MSSVLEVSSSGYYKWKKQKAIGKKDSQELIENIRKVFDKSKGSYGSPRIALQLKEENIRVSKNTIARRMKALKLVARPKKRFVITTDSEHDYLIADNILKREFEVELPNKVWVSDITYIRVSNFWMYLTVIIDLADRMVVGWSLSSDMTAENTVIAAFKIAVHKRKIKKNSQLIFHSDRGVQYACIEFIKILDHYNCIRSMSRKGNCWDNAVAESFFKTIKVERLNRYRFKSTEALNTEIFRYIDGWYNTTRIHTANNGKSPLKTFKMKCKSEYAN